MSQLHSSLLINNVHNTTSYYAAECNYNVLILYAHNNNCHNFCLFDFPQTTETLPPYWPITNIGFRDESVPNHIFTPRKYSRPVARPNCQVGKATFSLRGGIIYKNNVFLICLIFLGGNTPPPWLRAWNTHV